MKTNIKLGSLILALLGTITLQAETGWINTTKGPRLTTFIQETEKEKHLRTLEDFKKLRRGDKIVAWCPMMKQTVVTTIRNVDSKGRIKIKETKMGYALTGCNIVLKRKKRGSKEVQSEMVCPDGTLRPTECRKMSRSQ